jgi:hypothetical protein
VQEIPERMCSLTFVNYHPSRGHYCPAEAVIVSMLARGLVCASKGIQKWSLLW